MRRLSIALSLSILYCLAAHASTLDAINGARAQGCDGRMGIKRGLRSSAKLEEAARRLQRGASLEEAMKSAGYRSIRSTSIRMRGRVDEVSIARHLRNRFCKSLLDAALTEIGFHRKGQEAWLVLAQPFATPALRDASAVAQRVLELTNKARAQARRCGREPFAAALPMTLSADLRRAALAHSRDMAAKSFFEHEGSDGSQPAERISRQGYKWRVVGENLAAGITTPEEAVQGWLESPHHCANLMDPRFTQMGVAYVVNPASKLAIYWTQVFALPR